MPSCVLATIATSSATGLSSELSKPSYQRQGCQCPQQRAIGLALFLVLTRERQNDNETR
jgi:hypothetical protein